MDNNKGIAIKLYSIKKNLLLLLIQVLLFWLIFQNLLTSILISILIGYAFMMIYDSKLIIDKDGFKMSYFLRLYNPQKKILFEEVEKINFKSLKQVGTSDLITVFFKNGKIIKYYVYFSHIQLKKITEKLSNKVFIEDDVNNQGDYR